MPKQKAMRIVLFKAILRREEAISFENFKEHRSRIEAERSRLKTIADFITQRQHLAKADFEIALQLKKPIC